MIAASLNLRELGVTYGPIRALRSVSLELPSGTHFTLLGPSGAGKSTLLRAVAGLVRPTRGSVHWGQTCWSNAQGNHWLPPERRGIGMVAQDPALWPNLTVAEHLSLALRWRGVRRSDRAVRVQQLLEQVRLTGRARHRPAALSGGEAQRLALARALAGGSGLLLLDEPLGQLDAELRPTLAAEIQRISRSAGATVLHVTHDPAEALSFGDRVAVLEAGDVVQIGSPKELVAQPRTRFVARAVGRGNLVPNQLIEAFCRALALEAAPPPFAILEDGTGAFRACDLRLEEQPVGAGRIMGRVTRILFDGAAWLAAVSITLCEVELELQVTTLAPCRPETEVGLSWQGERLREPISGGV